MYAFIHVAKTGGKSIESMLVSSFGARHVRALEWEPRPEDNVWDVNFVVPKYDVADFRRLKRRCPFMKSVGGHTITLWSGVHEVQPTQYFGFLREPIKRGASHYQFHVRHDEPCLDWSRWVEWTVHHNHQVKMFSRGGDPDEAIRCIQEHEVFIGLTERFDESLVVFKRLFAPDLQIPYTRTNTASDNSIASELLADDKCRDQLKHMYRDDLPLYEWVSKEYYPRMVKEYGPTLAADVEAFRRQRDRVHHLNIKLNSLYAKFFIRRNWNLYQYLLQRLHS